MAQLVERYFHTVEVTGSIPVSPTMDNEEGKGMSLVVSESLKGLLAIQEFDLKIKENKRLLESLPSELKNVEQEFKGKSDQLAQQKDKHKQLLLDNKKFELDVKTNKDKEDKLNTQIMSAKTNQEYKAFEKEIFGLKTLSSQVEDRMLEKMEQIEQIMRVIADIEKDIQKDREVVQKRKREVEEQIQKIQTQIELDTAERNKLVPQVEPVTMKRYEKVIVRVHGAALVSVKDDRSCGGCHIKLTAQVWSDLHRVDRLVTCESCSRILYIEQQESAAE